MNVYGYIRSFNLLRPSSSFVAGIVPRVARYHSNNNHQLDIFQKSQRNYKNNRTTPPWKITPVATYFMLASIPCLLKKENKGSTNAILPSSVPVAISRLMGPDDTNPMGNVHGGTILKLIEQAGLIVSTRHCNTSGNQKPSLLCVLARVDHMDFLKPMYVGEVAHVQAAVTYTSPHSIEVSLDVWAENILSGDLRHTNSATLWYVAIPSNVSKYERQFKPVEVPPLQDLTPEQLKAGKSRHQKQKKSRAMEDDLATLLHQKDYFPISPQEDCEKHTVAASRSTLSSVIHPSDCTTSGHLMGGVLMKMMDTAAGICSVRHCNTPAVTASLDGINFHEPILNGELVFVTAQQIFTSTKSMIVEVLVEAEGMNTGRRLTTSAYFTFVSLNKLGKAKEVPHLKITNAEEQRKYDIMKSVYEQRKAERMNKK